MHSRRIVLGIMVLLVVLVAPCITEPDYVIAGPYNVSFDLGIPKDSYSAVGYVGVKGIKPLSGTVFNTYFVDIYDKQHEIKVSIEIAYNSDPQDVPSTDEDFMRMAKDTRRKEGDCVYDSVYRNIDGHRAAIVALNPGVFSAVYQQSLHEFIVIWSEYPYDKGTSSLFNTLHIEKVSLAV